MTSFQEETQQIVQPLMEAFDRISAVNTPNIQFKKSTILNLLNKHIVELNISLGIAPDLKDTTETFRTPLTSVLGKAVIPNSVPRIDINKPLRQSAAEVAQIEMDLQATELYPKILITDSGQLLDSLTDPEIRAVANKAGLTEVTEINPRRITVEFIEQIKDAMRLRNSKLEEAELSNLASATNRYEEFSNTDTKNIPNEFTEQEIKDIATLVGLPLKNIRIGKREIDAIKAAIKKQEELDNIVKNV